MARKKSTKNKRIRVELPENSIELLSDIVEITGKNWLDIVHEALVNYKKSFCDKESSCFEEERLKKARAMCRQIF